MTFFFPLTGYLTSGPGDIYCSGTTTERVWVFCQVFICLSEDRYFSTVQDALMKLYMCVAEMKKKQNEEDEHGQSQEAGTRELWSTVEEGELVPHFMPLVHIHFKLRITATQCQSFPSTLVKLVLLSAW